MKKPYQIEAQRAVKQLEAMTTAPCKQPVSMAIDVAHHRLFSGCRSGVMAVSDYRAGKIVGRPGRGGVVVWACR